MDLNVLKIFRNLIKISSKITRKKNKEHFLKADVQHSENLHEPHNNLLLLSELRKIDKVSELVAIMWHKKEYIIHIRHLKQAEKNSKNH